MDILQSELGFIDNNDLNKEVESLLYDDRTIIIDKELDTRILRDVVLHIVQWNKEDVDIPKEKRKPIKLVIDSEGGNVICTLNLIDIIKSSVTPVYGVAFSLAASSAAYILIACDKRFAFKHSTILLHDGTQAVYHTANKAKDTMRYYDRLDNIMKNLVVSNTNIVEEEYENNKDREQYFFAEEAKEKGIIDYIINVDIPMDEVL